MVIDFHLHIPEKWAREGVSSRDVAEKLVQFMDESGIDMGVILPIAPYIPNDYVYRVVSHEPRRLIGFASVVPNPADVAIRELKRAVKDLGLRGLNFIQVCRVSVYVILMSLRFLGLLES